MKDEDNSASQAYGLGGQKHASVKPATGTDCQKQLSAGQSWSAKIAYEQYGLSLNQIAQIAGIDTMSMEALALAHDWQFQEKTEEAADEPLQAVTMELAKGIIKQLREDIDALGKSDGERSDVEKRTKTHLMLAKSIRELEGMIKDLEQAAHARRYPQDVVEFRRQLEERIEALVNEETQNSLSKGVEG